MIEHKQPETLEEMETICQQMVRELGETFENPDDDWVPVLFLYNGEFAVGALDPQFFASDTTKNYLAHILRDVMSQQGVVRYALLLNVHAKFDMTKEELDCHQETGQRIETLDGAREMLWLVTGDAESERSCCAFINRTEFGPPTLSEWQPMPQEMQSGGRFVNLNERMSARKEKA